jgi:hypothetical protein
MNQALALHIRSTLQQLRGTPSAASVFGASAHEFVLAPPLSATDVEAFERRHAIALPDDYRWFITEIGDGGAGPFYGTFPVGHMDGVTRTNEPWSEDNGFVGILSRPFPLSESWNDVTGMPEDELAEQDEASYERLMDAFDARYWRTAMIDGAIPICHLGCALRIWLVVSGPERGFLWRDNRAEYGGLLPLQRSTGSRLTFLTWYESWLTRSIAEAQSLPIIKASSDGTASGRRSLWSRIFDGGA